MWTLIITLHVLAAAVWIGALVTLAAAVVPVARRELGVGPAVAVIGAVGTRLRWLTWPALATLVATGTLQVLRRANPDASLLDAAWWATPWGRLLAVKLVLVVVLLVMAWVHDFRVGPEATELARTDPDGERRARLRRQAGWLGRLELLVSLVILTLGVVLVRGPY